MNALHMWVMWLTHMWVMRLTHITHSYMICHINEFCLVSMRHVLYEWVIPHMNELWLHTYEWVMIHTYEWCMTSPPAPMNHVKYLRAGRAEMPFQNWYTAITNHFRLTDSVRWKSKTQLGWVINPVSHNLVRRIRFWRIKISGTWF